MLTSNVARGKKREIIFKEMKVNKTILSLCLIVSIGFNLYFINRPDQKTEKKTPIKNDSISTQQSAIAKNPNMNQVRNNNLLGIKHDILEIKDSIDSGLQETKVDEKNPYLINEEEVDKAKEVWRKKVSDFMQIELALDNNTIDQYLQLAQKREQMLSEFMQKRMEENGGDQIFYTLEDLVAENQINVKILAELKSMLGVEGYERYKKFRNDYNQKIIEGGEGFFLIEL